MSIECIGDSEMPDEANIPVNIFIGESDDVPGKWDLSASNFMPRRGSIAEGEYKYRADSREELVAWVREHIVPLYRTAAAVLDATGELYYWQAKQ